MDQFQQIKGRIVENVEVSDEEVLVTFTDKSEIAITLAVSGGDYGEPYLSTVVSNA